MKVGQEEDQKEEGRGAESQEDGLRPRWRVTPEIGEGGQKDRRRSQSCEEEELQSSSTLAVRSASWAAARRRSGAEGRDSSMANRTPR